MVKNPKTLEYQFGAIPFCLLVVLLSSSMSFAQESDDEPEKSPAGNVFSRMFGSGTKKTPPTTAPTKPTKPKVPATPTAGKTRNGFMMPLKSFTKAFRGQTETEEPLDVEETAPQRTIAPRIPREPFRNLPRVQERIDRVTNDLQVEEFPNVGISAPAPIVKPEQVRGNDSNNAPLKPLEGPNKKVDSAKSTPQPDLIIEPNSTSRRTAMDVLESSTPNRSIAPRIEPKSNAKSDGNTTPREQKPIKNLVDIGKSSSESTRSGQLTSAAREMPDKHSAIKNLSERDPNNAGELSKHARPNAKPAKSTKEEATAKTVASRENSNPVDLHREMTIPGVSVAVLGPSSLLIGEDGVYEIVAKNQGTEPVNGLMIRIAVPGHVMVSKVTASEGNAQPDNDEDGNAVVWELEHIPAGSSKSARIALNSPRPEHFALGVEWTVLPQSAEMQINVQQPQLALALEGPSEVEYGKPQMYRIRARNPGNADVKAVSIALSAEPYGSNQSDIGDIAAGSERVIEVELTFQQAGTLPIKASATSQASKLNAQSAIEVQVKQSELIATWFGPSEFYQGSQADYELELNNSGSIPAVGTICKIKLPAGSEVVALPPGATRSGDTLKWEIKKLDPQEKISYPLKLIMSSLGDNRLQFTAECTSGFESKADFVTNIDAIADLHLSVSDPVAPAPVGQPVVYEIVIANRGKKAASDVEVVAQFSDGIEPVRVEGHTGRIVPGQAIFNSIPSIGSNEKLVLRVVAQAAKAGVHRFRVEVKSQGSDTDLLEEESTRYLATSAKGERR